MPEHRLHLPVTPANSTPHALRLALESLEAQRAWFREDPVGFGREWFTSSSDEEHGLRADFCRAVEVIAGERGQEEAEKTVARLFYDEKQSRETAAEAAVRIVRSKRLGPRKRVGLLLFLEGVPVRRCAELVGLRDHAALYRRAAHFGLREIHRRRRQAR